MSGPADPSVLVAAEAATELGVSVNTVYAMVERGELSFVRRLPGRAGLLFYAATVRRLASTRKAAS